MKNNLWKRFIKWANSPTNNTGTGSLVRDETIELLRSIDARLANLEGCVRVGVKHKPNVKHIVTSHWNDVS